MSSKPLKRLLVAFAMVACAASMHAAPYSVYNPDGSINFGSAALFTVLTAGDMNAYDNTFTGPSYVQGNVGIGGSGNFSASDGQIDGDIYLNNRGTFKKSGPFKHNGTVWLNQDPVLNAALADAFALSAAAAAMPSSSSAEYTVNGQTQSLTTVNTGKSMTVAARPFATKITLNLQDFVLTNGTFTLQGTAAQSFVINVSNKFSINNSSVILSGGLLASHVLFNVTGSGSQVSLNQGVHLYGNLIAMKRKVALSGGRVHGRLYANQVAITSGGQVISQ